MLKVLNEAMVIEANGGLEKVAITSIAPTIMTDQAAMLVELVHAILA